MLKKITSIFLISALLLCLFACSGEKPMTGRELPPDTETLKTLSEEYDENLFYEERDRSADRVNFVLKETQNQGSDLVGVIAGKKNDDNIVNMTFTAGGIVYNDQLLSDLAVTPEDIAPTLTYLAKIYGIEDTDILYSLPNFPIRTRKKPPKTESPKLLTKQKSTALPSASDSENLPAAPPQPSSSQVSQRTSAHSDFKNMLSI